MSTTGTPSRDALQEITNKMNNLSIGQQRLNERIEKKIEKKPKIGTPEPFTGEPKKLQSFLTQMELHIDHWEFKREEDKVKFVGTYIKGDAAEWWEPIMRDYLENSPSARDDRTKEIFRDFKNLKVYMKKAFGDMNAKINAETKIRKIQQLTAVWKYNSEFSQAASFLDWDDSALMAMYRAGLKPLIREAIMYYPKEPNDLDEIMERALTADARIWGNKFEQSFDRRVPRQFKKRYNKVEYDKDGDVKMKGAAAEVKKKETRECFYCKKPGHIAKNCWKKKNAEKGKKPERIQAKMAQMTNSENNEWQQWIDNENDQWPEIEEVPETETESATENSEEKNQQEYEEILKEERQNEIKRKRIREQCARYCEDAIDFQEGICLCFCNRHREECPVHQMITPPPKKIKENLQRSTKDVDEWLAIKPEKIENELWLRVRLGKQDAEIKVHNITKPIIPRLRNTIEQELTKWSRENPMYRIIDKWINENGITREVIKPIEKWPCDEWEIKRSEDEETETIKRKSWQIGRFYTNRKTHINPRDVIFLEWYEQKPLGIDKTDWQEIWITMNKDEITTGGLQRLQTLKNQYENIVYKRERDEAFQKKEDLKRNKLIEQKTEKPEQEMKQKSDQDKDKRLSRWLDDQAITSMPEMQERQKHEKQSRDYMVRGRPHDNQQPRNWPTEDGFLQKNEKEKRHVNSQYELTGRILKTSAHRDKILSEYQQECGPGPIQLIACRNTIQDEWNRISQLHQRLNWRIPTGSIHNRQWYLNWTRERKPSPEIKDDEYWTGNTCNCYGWDQKCWADSKEDWITHIMKCEHCKNWEERQCPKREHATIVKRIMLTDISVRQWLPFEIYLKDEENGCCKELICLHEFEEHGEVEIPWWTCINRWCAKHLEDKEINGQFPKIPKITVLNAQRCPCVRNGCACQLDQRHPYHLDLCRSQVCTSDKCCEIHDNWKMIENNRPKELDKALTNEEFIKVDKELKRIKLIANRMKCQTVKMDQNNIAQIKIKINGKERLTLIDSGASENFISRKLADEIGVKSKTMKTVEITKFDGSTEKYRIGRNLIKYRVNDKNYQEEFTIIEMGQDCEVILGYPWLKKHNPKIDWQKKTVQIKKVQTSDEKKNEGNSHTQCGALIKPTENAVTGEHGRKDNKPTQSDTPEKSQHEEESDEFTYVVPQEEYKKRLAETRLIVPTHYWEYEEVFCPRK
jgi:predicted aspartyl protease